MAAAVGIPNTSTRRSLTLSATTAGGGVGSIRAGGRREEGGGRKEGGREGGRGEGGRREGGRIRTPTTLLLLGLEEREGVGSRWSHQVELSAWSQVSEGTALLLRRKVAPQEKLE